jgi:SAM-dependent methyltransferase
LQTLSKSYSSSFYYGHVEGSTKSADIILPLVLSIMHPQSILDVGCGTGTWLATASGYGIGDVTGVDGDWTKSIELKIPSDRFVAVDLSQSFDLGRRFDLVMSLEVAEHLPETASRTFVESLSRHGDVILFSAAVPDQGGTTHVNEQWPSYWMERFADLGYCSFDCIRTQIWDEKQVDPWYAQNIFLFANQSGVARWPGLRSAAELHQARPIQIVHPGLLSRTRTQADHPGIRRATKIMFKEIQGRIEAVFFRK